MAKIIDDETMENVCILAKLSLSEEEKEKAKAQMQKMLDYVEKLDELDLIARQYTIEVSSPGMDRELIHDKDFERFAGRIVEVKLYEPLNGQKSFEAELVGRTEEDVIQLDLDGERLEIPHKKISKINLAVIF